MNFKLIVLTFICVAFIGGCSPATKHKVLNTLFDGVPDLEQENQKEKIQQGIQDDQEKNDSTTSQDVSSQEIVPPKPKIMRHEPFAEKQCDVCHESSFSQKLVAQGQELCFFCHDDFLSSNPKTVHFPVEEGMCLDCHHPHQSKESKLLLKKSQELCLDCHDGIVDSENFIHAPVKDGTCSDCHDPHVSDQDSLLVKDSGGLCLGCHSDITKDKEVIHFPVEDGMCAECHDPHSSKNDFLLKKTGQPLCFDCHDKEELITAEPHESIEDEDCTSCHNPHAGDEFLL